jgi:PKD repeat protein
MGHMLKKLASGVAALTLLGVAGCAYDNPTQPGPPIVNPLAPAQVTVGATPGIGTQSGTAAVTANVQNVNGVALPDVVVTFATTRGTIAPAQVATGVNGTATATLTASDTADVTVSVGRLSAHTLVVSTGNPTSPPTPALPVSFLNVAGSGTAGVPVVFSVSSNAVGATWNWSFGDGANDQSTSFAISHTYGSPGVYTASVSSTAASSSSATVVINPPAAAPPNTTHVLGVTLTCPTSPTHGTTTACNITATYNGSTLPSAKVFGVDWDWGDGGQDKSSGPVATHNYANAGTYTIIVNVNANTPDGVATQMASATLVVK